MLHPNYVDVIEKPANNGEAGRYIDRELLKTYVTPNNEYYYICGPDKFTAIMVEYLKDLGVSNSKIVIEE